MWRNCILCYIVLFIYNCVDIFSYFNDLMEDAVLSFNNNKKRLEHQHRVVTTDARKVKFNI